MSSAPVSPGGRSSVHSAADERAVDFVEEPVPPPRHGVGGRLPSGGTHDDDVNDADAHAEGGGGSGGGSGGGDHGNGNEGADEAVVIVPYTARMDDELTLTPGQAIQLLDEADDGWVLGRCRRTGKEG